MDKKRILLIGDALDDQNAGVHTVIREVVNHIVLYHTEELDIQLVRLRKDPSLPLKQIVIPNPKYLVSLFLFIRKFFIMPLVAIYHKASVVVEFAHFGPFNLPRRIKRVT